jgi:hypothetical protein
MSHRENMTRIKAVYLALEELASEVVFVGGATVSLIRRHLLILPRWHWKNLKDQFRQLLSQKYIDEWISVHLEYNEQKRVGFILGSMTELVED